MEWGTPHPLPLKVAGMWKIWPWVKSQTAPPVNIPIPTKILTKMGGEFTNPKIWDPILIGTLESKSSPFASTRAVQLPRSALPAGGAAGAADLRGAAARERFASGGALASEGWRGTRAPGKDRGRKGDRPRATAFFFRGFYSLCLCVCSFCLVRVGLFFLFLFCLLFPPLFRV